QAYQASQKIEPTSRPTYYKNYMNVYLIASYTDNIWNNLEEYDNDILTVEPVVRGFDPKDLLLEYQITEADIIQSKNLDMIQLEEYTKENFQQVAATNKYIKMYPELLEAIYPNPKKDLTHGYCPKYYNPKIHNPKSTKSNKLLEYNFEIITIKDNTSETTEEFNRF
ncbi:4677_t:CDS:2, partial [Racocetra persica]